MCRCIIFFYINMTVLILSISIMICNKTQMLRRKKAREGGAVEERGRVKEWKIIHTNRRMCVSFVLLF